MNHMTFRQTGLLHQQIEHTFRQTGLLHQQIEHTTH